jgi:bifunctional non-homologous end joining protein LigD
MLAQTPAATPPRLLPMLATTAALFDDPAYIYEPKWDGVRALIAVDGDRVRFWDRNGVSYDGRYPALDSLRRRMPAATVLDGELVVIRRGSIDLALPH